MSKNTRTNNSIDFSWLIKTNWYPNITSKQVIHAVVFSWLLKGMIYEGGPKVHWKGAERTDFQRDRARLQWSAPQPHGLCDFKMIALFLNFFPGQQWCHHVCFSSSVHGQTRADCLWEVWICPPFLLKVAFHLASCVIESSITNWTSPKKERRHDKLVGHRIVPVCLICRSPVVWAVALFPSAGADMIFVNKKKLCHPQFWSQKIRRQSGDQNIC